MVEGKTGKKVRVLGSNGQQSHRLSVQSGKLVDADDRRSPQS